MKITKIECHVLLDPEYDPAATSSAQDDLVVEVHTDEGIVGIGETDLNPWIARECIEAPGTHTMDQGLGSMLIGENPIITKNNSIPDRRKCNPWEGSYIYEWVV